MSENNQEYKADAGKPLAGCLLEFGGAFLAMSEVSTFGALTKGYGRGTWNRVELIRYIDAFMRHVLKMGPRCDRIDPESGLPHRCHALWNLAAICQIMSENDQEEDCDETTTNVG